jgi:Rho GDP-dissociation inhibitor
MLARGSYSVKSRFIDDDKQVHLEFQWSFNIAKDWAN